MILLFSIIICSLSVIGATVPQNSVADYRFTSVAYPSNITGNVGYNVVAGERLARIEDLIWGWEAVNERQYHAGIYSSRTNNHLVIPRRMISRDIAKKVFGSSFGPHYSSSEQLISNPVLFEDNYGIRSDAPGRTYEVCVTTITYSATSEIKTSVVNVQGSVYTNKWRVYNHGNPVRSITKESRDFTVIDKIAVDGIFDKFDDSRILIRDSRLSIDEPYEDIIPAVTEFTNFVARLKNATRTILLASPTDATSSETIKYYDGSSQSTNSINQSSHISFYIEQAQTSTRDRAVSGTRYKLPLEYSMCGDQIGKIHGFATVIFEASGVKMWRGLIPIGQATVSEDDNGFVIAQTSFNLVNMKNLYSSLLSEEIPDVSKFSDSDVKYASGIISQVYLVIDWNNRTYIEGW